MNIPIEKTIHDINLSMSMENMPLAERDKKRLRDCLTGKTNAHDELRQAIERHTRPTDGDARL